MSLLRKVSISILSKMSGNNFVQKILQKNIQVSQCLMGIGWGGDVFISGEQVMFDVLAQRCQPPYCIFDIGANKGQFLNLTLKTISTNDFSIHCFEPGAETFRILNERESDNRVKLNNIGIGRKKGDMILYYDTPGSCCASLTKRKLGHIGNEFNKSETVHIETIDDYCTENTIKRIHLLKIDIEGHELDALAGAERMFAKGAIDIVTFEFGGCNIDTRTFFKDYWYFFSDVKMKTFRITPSGYLFPIESYKEFDEQYRGTTNFIAIKNG